MMEITKPNRRRRPLATVGKLLRARFRWQQPLYLIHSLTSRCNARCAFCAWTPLEDHQDELSTAEIEQLYRDAAAAGFIGVSVWGGEPLVHRDVGRLCRHAKQLGLATHMVTNGLLLERKLDDVVPYLDRICLSVDHPSDKHDELRGVRGLYGKIIAATRLLRRRYPRTRVIFVYTLLAGQNTDAAALREMAALTRSSGAVAVFNALRVEAASATAEDVALERFCPSQDELSAAFTAVRQLKEQGYPILNSFTHLDMMRRGPPEYRCHWPKYMLPIEANGDVVDCMHWGSRPLGNIRRTPFGEILKSPRLRALAGPAGEACHKCVSLHRVEISEICEGRLEPLASWASGLSNQPLWWSLAGKLTARRSRSGRA